MGYKRSRGRSLTRGMIAMRARAEGPCFWCEEPMTDDGGKRDKTFDHKVPLVRGGPHSIDNGRIICFACNCDKGNFTEEEYVAFLQSGMTEYEFKWTIPEFREAFIAKGFWTPEQVKASKEAKAA